jgi:hypothetical protein
MMCYFGTLRAPNKTSAPAACVRSPQLRVLRFGFFQDGDDGVGIFPEGEEIFLGGGIGIRRAFAQAGQSRAAVPTCASPLLRRGGRHYRET